MAVLAKADAPKLVPRPHERPRLSPLQHTLASQGASALSTILVYPMDTVRMRYMSQDGTFYRVHNNQLYSAVWRAVRVIYVEEGGLRAFFRGCHVSVLGSVCAWGVYMYAYRSLCASVETRRCRGATDSTTAGVPPSSDAALDNLLQRFGLSAAASCTSAIVCNPIWLLKTRMQLEEVSARTCAVRRHYKTLRQGLLHVIRSTGVRSLWRGVSAQVLLGLPNALNLPIYDTLKTRLLHYTHANVLATWQVCLCQTVTKVALALLCQPLLVAKTRMQDHRARLGNVTYTSLMQTAQTMWGRGGVRGLYRGMLPSLYQTVPRAVLMFMLYEQALQCADRMQR